MNQMGFSELEFAAKKKRTRRERFLDQIEAATPWALLVEQIEPFYPHVVKNLFRHRKVRYRGLAKNTAQLFSLFALANLVLARRLLPPQGVSAS